MQSENILKRGGKRLRHGSYKVVYWDNHGNGYHAWRGEIQTCNAGGAIRLRKWFKYRDDALAWIHGRAYGHHQADNLAEQQERRERIREIIAKREAKKAKLKAKFKDIKP